MSRSEIVAWNLGVAIEAEAEHLDAAVNVTERLAWNNLTEEQSMARWALGDALFAHYVVQGMGDAHREHPG